MGYDPLSILKLCGIAGALLFLAGAGMLLVATRRARREYRTKGFLRPPSGTELIRFLFWKQYDYFENPGTRFLFGATHFCMMGALLILGGVVALIGTELLLNGVNNFSLSPSPNFQDTVDPK